MIKLLFQNRGWWWPLVMIVLFKLMRLCAQKFWTYVTTNRGQNGVQFHDLYVQRHINHRIDFSFLAEPRNKSVCLLVYKFHQSVRFIKMSLCSNYRPFATADSADIPSADKPDAIPLKRKLIHLSKLVLTRFNLGFSAVCRLFGKPNYLPEYLYHKFKYIMDQHALAKAFGLCAGAGLSTTIGVRDCPTVGTRRTTHHYRTYIFPSPISPFLLHFFPTAGVVRVCTPFPKYSCSCRKSSVRSRCHDLRQHGRK